MRARHAAAGELAASDRAPQPRHPWVAAAGTLCSPTGSRLSGSLHSPLKPKPLFVQRTVHQSSLRLTIILFATIVSARLFCRVAARRTEMSWTVDPMHTQVEFSAKHMCRMTVRRPFTELEVAADPKRDALSSCSV